MSTVRNPQQQKEKRNPLLTFGSFRFSEFQVLIPLKANFTMLPPKCYWKSIYLFMTTEQSLPEFELCKFTLSKHGHPSYTPVSMVN